MSSAWLPFHNSLQLETTTICIHLSCLSTITVPHLTLHSIVRVQHTLAQIGLGQASTQHELHSSKHQATEQLWKTLLVAHNGRLLPLSKLTAERDPNTMAAAAAISSPFSSQEHNDLPFRRHIDNPFSPPPSGQAALTDENVLSLGTSGFALNLQDIHEFEKEKPYDPDRLVPLQTTKVSVEYTIKFQHLCDRHHIRPEFEYEQPWPQNFKAKIVLDGETLETAEVFPSRKLAKESLAQQALERFPSLVEHIASAGAKRKVDDSNLSSVDRSENWVGLLNDNFLRTKRHAPMFQDYSTERPPFRFSCAVSLDGGPLEPFRGAILASKQDAKVGAAKLAVEWLRGQGVMTTPVKRPKPDAPSSSHTGVTQTLHTTRLDREHPPDSPSSAKQRLHHLVATLGFQQPSWQIEHSVLPGKPAAARVPIYDAALRFDAYAVAREPSLAGPTGRVEQIHGINNAKEACCERVLAILEDLTQTKQIA